MKKLVIAFVFTLCLSAPLLRAQGQVSTRSHKLADFPDRVTKVVLTENDILSGALREEVVSLWTASAFEFCTLEQFQALKTREDLYFLMILETRQKGEENPGVSFLTLLKGGPEAEKGLSRMHEAVSLPLEAVGSGDGRALVYLGALVQAIQDYTLAAMESEMVAYSSASSWFKRRYTKEYKSREVLTDPAQADKAFQAYEPGFLALYEVAPLQPGKGSFCHRLLFDTALHSLVSYTTRKIK